MSAVSSTTGQAFSLKTRQPIDEDALLTEEDRLEKEATKGEDCTTRRRACKNCTCGRAQLEQQQQQGINVDVQMPPGGCGNCAKGDAFRCATCPFLGKPAFDNTSDGKVKLNLMDDI
ncbi:Anamorsin [Trypanosoma melophagium]|uniref:Anamorsin n=1 Tax=Trypanosoma melophagium TaxID=715481 RepID=UPI00351A639A|nr:Anamorsin [Trypanosoma melophagium]